MDCKFYSSEIYFVGKGTSHFVVFRPKPNLFTNEKNVGTKSSSMNSLLKKCCCICFCMHYKSLKLQYDF